jgi:hypothetical protein
LKKFKTDCFSMSFRLARKFHTSQTHRYSQLSLILLTVTLSTECFSVTVIDVPYNTRIIMLLFFISSITLAFALCQTFFK